MPNARRAHRKLEPPVRGRRKLGLEDVIARLEEHGREYNQEFLRSVYEFSAAMHRDQLRRSGEPYLSHPLYVAYILADLDFDQDCVTTGLLHDVLEDTLSTRETLEQRFGSVIAELVDGVTKIGRHAYVRRDEAQAETFRKMILASAKDIRVILVKLADRLHNMMTLEHMPPEARRRISQETLEIYAPIAQRLGMSKVQGDLADLAFFYLYPHQFTALKAKIEEKMKLGHDATERIRKHLERALRESDIECEISYRVKRFYSIYQKLRRQGIDISQLYDYLAFRIITENLKDTYAALGVVHQIWRPIPGRFKDYIAMPKPNLYRSLHTTLVGEKGQPFEVQIRTREMDRVAEEGIAAHWRYKEGGEHEDPPDQNILWLRQLVDWQKEVQDPRAFLTALKIDLYPDEVYAFTPKGDVHSFPRGATPLDFAYRIHTEIGTHCSGARVNGRLVPLRTALSNGDIVEILTNPAQNPSRDWLNWVETSRAKSKIRQWLNTEQKERATEIGRRMIERGLRRYRVSLKRFLEHEQLAAFLAREGIARPEDMFGRVGFGKLTVRQVLDNVLGERARPVENEEPGRIRKAVSRILPFTGASKIEVKGHSDLLAYLAKCCNPLPGEPIVGYITRGRGVSVHSLDCPNVKKLFYNPDREIEVEWARQEGDVYPITLLIETEDRPGMLARLTEAIAKQDSNIRQIDAETFDTGRGMINVVVEVKNRKHLERVRQGLRGVAGVIQVSRLMGSGGPHSEALH